MNIVHIIMQCWMISETAISGQCDIFLFPVFIQCFFTLFVEVTLFDLQNQSVYKNSISKDYFLKILTYRNGATATNFTIFIFIIIFGFV